MIPTITPDEIIDRYDAVLLDAYGVLVHSQGALPGAAAFLDRLRSTNTNFLVVTNDASRLPETCAQRYASVGLELQAHQVLTSGQLVVGHLESKDITKGPVLVLGARDSKAYLEQAGYELVEPGDDRAEAVVVADQSGFDFVPAIDATLSMLVRAFNDDRDIELVCPNPDLLYPSGPDSVGFTAGAICALIESSLRPQYPDQLIEFARLGKPHPALFKRAVELLNTQNIAMLGDQLATDIRGANEFGIDSILAVGGLSRADRILSGSDVEPTYLLDSLQ